MHQCCAQESAPRLDPKSYCFQQRFAVGWNMWYTALFFRCCCEIAFCFVSHMAEVRRHRFKHDTNMTHAHWSVNLPGPSKQQKNSWSSDERSGRKFLQAPILCQDLGSQDRGPRLDPNSISSAPDAVGHAWARTHARENARQNARKNVNIYVPDILPDNVRNYVRIMSGWGSLEVKYVFLVKLKKKHTFPGSRYQHTSVCPIYKRCSHARSHDKP